MNELTETMIYCPYCGECIEVLINPEDAQQSYIEDCQVCCKPITFIVTEANNGDLSVAVYSENDTY